MPGVPGVHAIPSADLWERAVQLRLTREKARAQREQRAAEPSPGG
jgi:hypothetical protein